MMAIFEAVCFFELNSRAERLLRVRGRPERDEGLPPRRRSSRIPVSDAEVSETIEADSMPPSW